MADVLGILSDAHGNGASFLRAVDLLAKEGADRFVFLGDAVGYIPSLAVLDEIASMGSSIQCTLGNHEAMLISPESFPASAEIYEHRAIREKMSAVHWGQITSWPDSLNLSWESTSALFCHGIPPKPITGYLYEDQDFDEVDFPLGLTFMGNTHRPFIRQETGRKLVNVGSCGLPRDDGRFGSAGLLDTRSGSVELLRFRIDEDLENLRSQFFYLDETLWEFRLRVASELWGRVVT